MVTPRSRSLLGTIAGAVLLACGVVGVVGVVGTQAACKSFEADNASLEVPGQGGSPSDTSDPGDPDGASPSPHDGPGGGDAPDGGRCALGTKPCDGQCVAIGDPKYGCAETTCAPCSVPEHSKAVCKATACEFVCDDDYAVCQGSSGCTKLGTFYKDSDGDGYGAGMLKACFEPPDYITTGGDCHDGNTTIRPGQANYYNSPYTLPGSMLTSFDYDCDGFEKPEGSLPACADPLPTCGGALVNTQCMYPGSIAGRATTPNPPNPSCGGYIAFCRDGDPNWYQGSKIRCH